MDDYYSKPVSFLRFVCDVFCMNVYMLSHFSHVQLCVALWTKDFQAPLSTGFSRQEY